MTTTTTESREISYRIAEQYIEIYQGDRPVGRFSIDTLDHHYNNGRLFCPRSWLVYNREDVVTALLIARDELIDLGILS